jgi:hypothetical protein
MQVKSALRPCERENRKNRIQDVRTRQVFREPFSAAVKIAAALTAAYVMGKAKMNLEEESERYRNRWWVPPFLLVSLCTLLWPKVSDVGGMQRDKDSVLNT